MDHTSNHRDSLHSEGNGTCNECGDNLDSQRFPNRLMLETCVLYAVLPDRDACTLWDAFSLECIWCTLPSMLRALLPQPPNTICHACLNSSLVPAHRLSYEVRCCVSYLEALVRQVSTDMGALRAMAPYEVLH
eukprot:6255395-Amphidinium_carterae.1